jgi:hypothetical protein
LAVEVVTDESSLALGPGEIAKRSSGDSPPEDGEARPLGIGARMPGFTSLISSVGAA